MRAKRKQSPTNRWSRSTEKEQYWRSHIQAWAASGLSVRAYCQEIGVVETSFYAWRRELGIRDREQVKTACGADSEELTVKDSRGRSIPLQFRESVPIVTESEESKRSKLMPFARLNIVQDDPCSESLAKQAEKSPASIAMTITTPGGFSISLNRSTDIEHLRAVLNKLEDNRC
jgi:hypothetical protein